MKVFFPILKIVLIILGAGIIAFAGLLIFLTITEYRPKPVETVDPEGEPEREPRIGEVLRVAAWNIGYAGLDAGEDFFMDGGRHTRPDSPQKVRENISGIRAAIDEMAADIILLQEVDINSRRSYHINESAFLAETWPGSAAFAFNFKTLWVPIPFPDMIGGVESGLLTLNSFKSEEFLRLSLPIPFQWPVRIANLKRCILVERLPVAGSEKQLVLVNLHLEAYSSGEGRNAQMEAMLDFLQAEYGKGNFCVAGGDFNQNFPGLDPEIFRLKDTKHFLPGSLSQDMLPEGWQFAADPITPSSRLNNEPYSSGSGRTQFYVIDGFILSPNVHLVSVKTLDAGFRYTDHNPVLVTIYLE